MVFEFDIMIMLAFREFFGMWCVSCSSCMSIQLEIGFYFLFKENWTEEDGILLKKTTGPGWPWNEKDCGTHKKILVCDYISFCCPVVWFVYIYIHRYILHYTNNNILRTNIVDTWITSLS